MVDLVKMATDDEIKKQGRDPILLVCAITLILAFSAVGGIYVNDHFLNGKNGGPATTGQVVTANYNGSFYNYYDEGGIVFDTSFWNIADNDDYKKSFEFNLRSESSYKPLTINVGDPKHSGLLPEFANAVIGLSKGDVARVVIDPENGYGVLTKNMLMVTDLTSAENTEVNVVEEVAVDLFNRFYNDGKSIGGNIYDLKSPYGWNIDASYSPGNNYVMVTHNAVVGEEYEMSDGVTVKVISITGGVITFEYDIEYNKYTQNFPGAMKDAKFTYEGDPLDKEYEYVKGVKVFVGDRYFYLYAVDNAENPNLWVMKYILTDAEKTARGLPSSYSETTGMFLCFAITVDSVS